jgi:transposase
MSQEIRANYDQMDLLPQCLEDWVPRDHPARFLREFVDALNLAELGFQQRESEEGRPSYAADLLLKVWVYGYLRRIHSTRELEKACREHLGLLWLTGRNDPDHNPSADGWRFWRDNRRALGEVFRQVVQVARRNQLVGLICHAVDGTMVRAACSRRTMEHAKELKEDLAKVEASIREMEEAVEAAEAREEGEYRLPEALVEKQQLREAIRDSLAKMQAAGREHLHPQEPEARMMKCEGRAEPAYNAQAVVEEEHQLIVAEAVVKAENDAHQLTAMIGEVEQNLGEVAKETVADGSYGSAEELGKAEAQGYGVVVSLKDPTRVGEFHSSRFQYDPESDQVVCPRGETLRLQGIRRHKQKPFPLRVYRCQNFRDCPLREACTRDRHGRLVEIGPYHGAVERQRQKQAEAEKRQLLKKRKGLVEPVFGTIKQAMGFRRYTVRGLEKVQTQWSLICAAFNLRKLHAFWIKGRLELRGPRRLPPGVGASAALTPRLSAGLRCLAMAFQALAPRPSFAF